MILWVPGLTITFCNKITALSVLGILSMFPSLFSSTKAANQSLDADDTLGRRSGCDGVLCFWCFLDYEQSLVFLSPSSETRETRKWPRACLKARDVRGTEKERLPPLLGFSRLAASPFDAYARVNSPFFSRENLTSRTRFFFLVLELTYKTLAKPPF